MSVCYRGREELGRGIPSAGAIYSSILECRAAEGGEQRRRRRVIEFSFFFI